MPLLTGGRGFALAIAALGGYTVAAQEDVNEAGGTNGFDHVEFAVEPAGGKDQGHVVFSIGGDDPAAGDNKGDGHIVFSVDPSAAYSIGVEILPGPNGAEICGTDRGEGHVEFSIDGDVNGQTHVDFRVAVRPDGGVVVNGKQLAACDPTRGCRISLTWFPGAGTIAVQVVDANGAAYAGQYAMACPPDEIHVVAAEVR